jgi:tetratricopeptide (TPR) repeat protein
VPVGVGLLGLLTLLAASPSQGSAQIPAEFTNLQHFPEDITRDSLVQVMRGFSFALGVRCQYCHVGGDGVSFEGVEFASDDDPDKRKARWMLGLVNRLNAGLAEMPDRDTPVTAVECKTCHHGQSKPRSLQMVLAEAIDNGGPDAAVELYAELRENYWGLGVFNFGEWEMNELARMLSAADEHEGAVAMLLVNEEHYSESVAIQFMLGQEYEALGDTDAAVARYERTLELAPQHGGAQARLEALR